MGMTTALICVFILLCSPTFGYLSMVIVVLVVVMVTVEGGGGCGRRLDMVVVALCFVFYVFCALLLSSHCVWLLFVVVGRHHF